MKHKRLKKLLAMALTFVMAFALASPAFADEPTGSIKIKKPSDSSISIVGQTFKVYRIFSLTMSNTSDPENSVYSYTLVDRFKELEDEFELNGKTFVEYIADLTNPADIDAFAAVVWDWIEEKSEFAADGTGTGSSGTNDVTISNLPLGYYLVYGEGTAPGKDDNNVEVVAACALTTVWPNKEITLKADVPTIEKKVSAGPATSPTGYGDYTDLDIGDTAYFKLTSKVPNMQGYTSYTYTVHDTLSKGLTYNASSLAVKVDTTPLVADTDYTTTSNTDQDTGITTITITFDNFIQYNNTTYTDADIIITYSATLNANAVVADSTNSYAGNPNKVYLEYSNNPYGTGTGETPEDEVYVYTFKFDIYKYTPGDEDAKISLAGAEFSLFPDSSGSQGSTAISFIASGNSYRRALTTETSGATPTLVSGTDGKITLTGLDEGTYWLKETKAPNGYNPLAEAIPVKIVPAYGTNPATLTSYAVQIKNSDNNFVATTTLGQVDVQNNTGVVFPESGGIGRTIFTVVGLVLMLGAGVIMIARRKTAGR
jgi:fimbrial isopeptide formation D2 family protein